MTRYERVKEILDNISIEALRLCPASKGCACRGCVTGLGIRQSELDWYLETHLKDRKD